MYYYCTSSSGYRIHQTIRPSELPTKERASNQELNLRVVRTNLRNFTRSSHNSFSYTLLNVFNFELQHNAKFNS